MANTDSKPSVREAMDAVSEVVIRRYELAVRRCSSAGLGCASDCISGDAFEELDSWWGFGPVVGSLLLDEALLLVRVIVGSGLAAESGVIDPLVPDLSICLLPPRSSPPPVELSGEQAVTFCIGAVGLGKDGRLYDPDATSPSAIKAVLVEGGERSTFSASISTSAP